MARQFSTGTKFGSEKGKVQKPARIPPQTPPAGGKKAEAGQFHSPRKIVCPAEPSQFRSDIFKQTPPSFTFCEIVRNSLGAKFIRRIGGRLGMVFFRNFEGIFEIARMEGAHSGSKPLRTPRLREEANQCASNTLADSRVQKPKNFLAFFSRLLPRHGYFPESVISC